MTKLDRVRQNICEDLRQTERIPQYRKRARYVYTVLELDSLLFNAMLESLNDRLEDVMNLKWNTFYFEPAGLNLAMV